MEYHRPISISISNYNLIQEKLKDKLKIITIQKQILLSTEEKKWLSTQLLSEIESLTGKQHKITNAILFIQQPKAESSIHVDGISPIRLNHPNWALNIPITKSDAEMSWYEGVYSLNIKDSQGLAYLDINWQHGPNLAKIIKIDQPIIVNIDKPHKVVNFSNHVRMILSVRFTPDLC